MAIIYFSNNGNHYKIQSTANKLNRVLFYNKFEKFSEDIVELDDKDFNAIMSSGLKYDVCVSYDHLPWQEHPATKSQMNYLRDLGVNLQNGAKLTKGVASKMIDSIKSGDGIGHFGFEFVDGSN